MMRGFESTSFAWFWVAGAAALIGLVAGLAVLILGRSATDQAGVILAARLARGEIDQDDHARRQAILGLTPRAGGLTRVGAVLVILSLVVVLVLAGWAVTGTLPRPGPASVEPGSSGFVSGTSAAPRFVWVVAGPGLRFYPDVIPIKARETVIFVVTTMGIATHEFMVGPAADVAADTEGTPEVAGIGMMQTKSVTYTFTGSGPFAFACHAPGHYEAGMKGTIEIQP